MVNLKGLLPRINLNYVILLTLNRESITIYLTNIEIGEAFNLSPEKIIFYQEGMT
jgi:hypothetical protein